ncbi:RNA polymerase sigma-70 factor (ECF subfamily) [Asanoa ferruginea]|uniref:RNA polymerase sigma-70 factor (ECF subfamily) n=1 Tax=Asanoa ferruginea TaxID=53367 RepID=A0A3D9ZM87_9ACTN|nr:SigE family RNA polymerase sigma factor [Asanoa ferruginea]REF97969.1 RNA polymerase sigma-70 factor (ECF subfamily) [Asanoa ferruginea]GIF50005.1 RNA polymerase sigma24 factor [Asanoa ferruginea]
MGGGGTADFDDFYRASRRRMLGYIYVLTGDIVEAQDVVQEAFVRAWQRWSTVGGYADPEAWVRVVAARIAISRWRGRMSRARAYARHGAPTPVEGPTPDTVALVAALRRLPAAQRTTLALHYVLGLSVADIAGETNAAVGTVKARLSRGRAALAVLLADEDRPEVEANRG